MPESSGPTPAQALRERLEQAQAEMIVALDEGDTLRVQTLAESREADLVQLSKHPDLTPEIRSWAATYQARDKELIARLIVARDAAGLKVTDLRAAQSIHRAYTSAGLR